MIKPDEARGLLAILRESESDVAGVLFCDDAYKLPTWSRHLYLIPILAFASLAALKLTWLAAFPLAATLLAIFAVQIKLYMPMMLWHLQRDAIARILDFGAKWRHATKGGTGPLSASDHVHFARLEKRFRKGVGGSAWLSEYLNVLVLHQYREFHRQLTFLQENLDALRLAYLAVGFVESSCALTDAIRAGIPWCKADRGRDLPLRFVDVGTPLLEQATPVAAVEIRERGLFITGQNASGKSTLLRSIGINLLFSASFGGCFARSAQVPTSALATSINAVDSIEAGNSLYVAELKRAKKLLQLSRSEHRSVILLDELFRGTNYLESVAAAGATIRAMSRNSIVIATSHNLALAPMLADVMPPMCLSKADDGTIRLEPGVLAETNGLLFFEQYLLVPSRVIMCQFEAGHYSAQGR